MNSRRLVIIGVSLLAVITVALVGYSMMIPAWNAESPGAYYQSGLAPGTQVKGKL